MKNGEYKMVCDRCGNRFPDKFLTQEEDTNLWVCNSKGLSCWDPHDVFNDPIRVKSTEPVKDARPFTSFVPECYSDAIADIAVADCTTADFVIETVSISNG